MARRAAHLLLRLLLLRLVLVLLRPAELRAHLVRAAAAVSELRRVRLETRLLLLLLLMLRGHRAEATVVSARRIEWSRRSAETEMRTGRRLVRMLRMLLRGERMMRRHRHR